MGLFTKARCYDYETIERLEREWRDYYIVFELREYTRYERLLIWRGRKRRQQIRVRAFTAPYDAVCAEPGTPSPLVEEKSTWDADRAPNSGWEWQADVLFSKAKAELRERDSLANTFTSAVDAALPRGE